MVDSYAKVIPLLKEEKTIALFAILKMDDLTDRWSILVSGTGIEEEKKRRELYNTVSKILTKELPPEEIQNIARVGVFALDSHIVKDILKFKEGAKIIETRANGSFVHEGYVFISKKL